MIEFLASFIFPFAIQQFLESLLNLVGFQGISCQIFFIGFQCLDVIFFAIQKRE